MTLGVYDVNKSISDGVVVLINRVRTPREELLGRKKMDFVYFEIQKLTLGYMMSIKNIAGGMVVLINLVRIPCEEILDPRIQFRVF